MSGASDLWSLIPESRYLSLPDDVSPLRWRELERVGRELGIAAHVAERQVRRLAERVRQLHLSRQIIGESEANALELRVGGLRRRIHVLEAVALPPRDQI